MFAIIGVLVVFGAVVGGYLMEKGNLLVLMQPAELLIIAGAAAGTLLVANPPHVITAILKGILEAEIEEPSKSKTLATQPAIAKDHHICAFICDTFRTTMIGGMEPFDVDQMLETDIEVLHHEGVEQAGALTTVADSLPSLAMVAAVVGVVITMGALVGQARGDRAQSGRRPGEEPSSASSCVTGWSVRWQPTWRRRTKRREPITICCVSPCRPLI